MIHIDATVSAVCCFGFLHAWGKNFVRGRCARVAPIARKFAGLLQGIPSSEKKITIGSIGKGGTLQRSPVAVDSGRQIGWIRHSPEVAKFGQVLRSRAYGRGVPVTWLIVFGSEARARLHMRLGGARSGNNSEVRAVE